MRTLVALLAVAACARDEAQLTDNPLHLAAAFDRAVAEGSEPPRALPDPVEWRFEDGESQWAPAVPWNPIIGPATVTRANGVLRVTLTEATRGYISPDAASRLFTPSRGNGGIAVDLPGWNPDDWGHIEVRARTSDPLNIGVGINQRRAGGQPTSVPFHSNSPVGPRERPPTARNTRITFQSTGRGRQEVTGGGWVSGSARRGLPASTSSRSEPFQRASIPREGRWNSLGGES